MTKLLQCLRDELVRRDYAASTSAAISRSNLACSRPRGESSAPRLMLALNLPTTGHRQDLAKNEGGGVASPRPGALFETVAS